MDGEDVRNSKGWTPEFRGFLPTDHHHSH